MEKAKVAAKGYLPYVITTPLRERSKHLASYTDIPGAKKEEEVLIFL